MQLVQLSAFALIGAISLSSAATAGEGGDRHFLDQALKGDNSEMMLGQMATERGGSPALRAYGRTLHDDHARARGQIIPLARQAGVAISEEPTPEALQEQRKLEHLHGAAFDHEFASYMVKDHRQDISDFEAEAHKRGPAGDLAKETLPVLRKHLSMAERLAHS